jgi:mRNA deadenylase 3'-5' endonuclease subunit Ccr4
MYKSQFACNFAVTLLLLVAWKHLHLRQHPYLRRPRLQKNRTLVQKMSQKNSRWFHRSRGNLLLPSSPASA